MKLYILLLLSLIGYQSLLKAQEATDRVLADSLFLQAGRYVEAAALYKQLADAWAEREQLDSLFQHKLLQAKALMQAHEFGLSLAICDTLLTPKWRAYRPSKIGDVLALKGFVELQFFRLEAAKTTLQQAIQWEWRQPSPDSLKIAQSKQNLGLVYTFSTQTEAAEKELLEAYMLMQAVLPEDDLELAYVANSLYLHYDEQYRFEEAALHLEEAARILQLHLPSDHPHIATILHNLGSLRHSQGDLEAARGLFSRLGPLNLAAGRPRMALQNYNNLANLLLTLGDAEGAGPYLAKYLVLGDSLYPNPGFERANMYDAMGSQALAMSHYARADSFFSLALDQKITSGEPIPADIARSYHNRALVAGYTDRWPEAAIFYQKSLRLREESLGAGHPLTQESRFRLGQVKLAQGEPDKAIRIWKTCLRSFIENQGTSYHHVADMAFWIAEVYHQQGQRDSTDVYLKWAWTSMLGLSERFQDWDQLPHYRMQLISAQVFEIFQFHLQVLLQDSILSPGQKLALTRDVVQQFGDFLPHILPLLNSRQAQGTLSQNLRTFYAQAALILHEATQHGLLLDEALLLECIENSRAFTIRLALQREKALKFGGLSDSTFYQVKKLQNRIWDLHAQRDSRTGIERTELEQQMAAVQGKWEALQQEIARQSPGYHKLLYQKPVVDQQKLHLALYKADQSVLAYFELDSALLATTYSAGVWHTHLLHPGLGWQDSIRQFNNLLQLRGSVEKLGQLGAFLYQELFAPIAPHLSRRLLILADGPLHFLNFELLVQPDTVKEQAPPSWLFATYRIQYANRLGPAFPQQIVGKKNLAIAPGFGKAEKEAAMNMNNEASGFGKWLSTPWSVALVKELESTHWGEVLIGQAATKTQFFRHAEQARIIHFASHAQINDTAPLRSFLALFPEADSLHSEYLFAHELYGRPLPSSLVFLSACQTGMGQYQAGEGVLSLAHAFQYAGSPSLIMSLWSIDDQQTNWLVREFYQKLDQGLSISDALYEAKRAYLETHSGEQAHPYYWGGLVFTGENHAIDTPFLQKNHLLYLLGFLALTGIFFIYWQKNRKKVRLA